MQIRLVAMAWTLTLLLFIRFVHSEPFFFGPFVDSAGLEHYYSYLVEFRSFYYPNEAIYDFTHPFIRDEIVQFNDHSRRFRPYTLTVTSLREYEYLRGQGLLRGDVWVGAQYGMSVTLLDGVC